MKNKYCYVFVVILTNLFFLQNINAQQNSKATIVKTDVFKHSPSLYSDKINLQILLVNLPGANSQSSTFQGTYKMYFMPEGAIEEIIQSKGGIINKVAPSDISNKILLDNGSFNKKSLASNRIFEKNGIFFKQKVPDKQKTMRGRIIVFYTVKIYDAKLAQNIYKDGSFTYFLFNGNDTTIPRQTFHISFFVNENGRLYTSSLPRDTASAAW